MKATNFSIVNKSESINIADWKEKHPNYCAIVERDKEKDGYGWIRYRGPRPYPYSLKTLIEAGKYNEELHCNPADCYEIIPNTYTIPKKGVKLSPERMREVTKAMNE